MKLVTGFRDFVLRGNVIDLAVAVVIGAAFTGVVTSLVDNLVNPLIAAVGGAPDLDGLWPVTLREVDGQPVQVQLGSILGDVLNLVLVAAVVYFLIVTPVNRLLALRKEQQAPAPAAPSEDVRLLTEIRDLLAQQRDAGAAGGPAGPGA
ncbi:large-conductance mechanosensitive channel protein MscL [Kineococcus gypseus]|uniref:large conductance mechanosensitive channel protein MscL n=1 Tax=Kineococcus gypseus TaxID=1637102 RepID=UPI003D7D8F9D